MCRSRSQRGSDRVCCCRFHNLSQWATGDNLGKLAATAASVLNSGISFSELCVHHRSRSCLANLSLLPHTTSSFLSTLRSKGAPAVQMDSPWTLERLDAAAYRGPHQSTHEHIDFMRQEFSEMVEAGQWLALPYSAIRGFRLHLQCTPTGGNGQHHASPRTSTASSKRVPRPTTTNHHQPPEA
jgi:hypothetical protein